MIRIEDMAITDKSVSQFWSHVDRSGGLESCWLWTGAKRRNSNDEPYGFAAITAYNGWRKGFSAHRLAYMLERGGIEAGLCVRHTCDTTLCCNPSHLILGTQADNMMDKCSRGRQARGIGNGAAKLNELRVQEIRADLGVGLSVAEVARKYAMSYTAINSISKGKTWKSDQALGLVAGVR